MLQEEFFSIFRSFYKCSDREKECKFENQLERFMKKITYLIPAILLCSIVKADLAPNPVQAKGITIKVPTEIKMTYERVIIDLTIIHSMLHRANRSSTRFM
jgi:hypothetical protein